MISPQIAERHELVEHVSIPSLVIVGDEGDYNVWISLPDHDPVRDAFGFVIGCGDTRDAAVADAVASLEGALSALQSPRGLVPERVA